LKDLPADLESGEVPYVRKVVSKIVSRFASQRQHRHSCLCRIAQPRACSADLFCRSVDFSVC
jgi:hypothetical protein